MKDRFLGAAALGVAAILGVFGRDLQAPISYEPVGPRAFPWVLAVLIAAVGLWLVFRPASSAPAVDASAANAEPRILGRDVLLVLVAVLGYALLFEVLGFVVATGLMTVAVGRLFGGGWGVCAAVGVALGAGLYLVFDRLLDVTLPTGVLGSIL